MPTQFLDLKYNNTDHTVLSYRREDGTVCVVDHDDGDFWQAIHSMGLDIADYVPPPPPSIEVIRDQAKSAVDEATIKAFARKNNPALARIHWVKAWESDSILSGSGGPTPHLNQESESTGVPLVQVANNVQSKVLDQWEFEVPIEAQRIRTKLDIDRAQTEEAVRAVVESYSTFLKRRDK